MSKVSKNFFECFLLSVRGVLFIIIGLYIAIPSAKLLYKVYDGILWPHVNGSVISSALESRWVSRNDDRGQAYCSRVLYNYAVNDKQYISDEIRFFQTWTSSRKEVEEDLAKYPPGNEVRVYYNPVNPRFAVLDIVSVPSFECVRLAVGLLLVLIGVMTFFSRCGRQKQEDSVVPKYKEIEESYR